MGRTFRKIESKMDLEEVKETLRDIGNVLSAKTKSVDCFLFGSILKEKFPNDVDLLIVYNDESQLRTVKAQFEAMSLKYPLHFIYLTFLEEEEFDFIKQQAAELV